MKIADLHIHSKYSRATSGDCDAPHLDLWARYKGISLVGTGDFTHPKWREELAGMLTPDGEGLYRLREEYALPCRVPGAEPPRFVVSGEISTIYKRNGKTRKVHHVILLPGLEEAEELAHRLEAIGNLHSDGRPILGMDSRDLMETVLESCPEAIYIPAHIWTPHFSLFGAFSGFDSLEECYGDLAPYIRAVETGLSSDPPMNRRLSMLDGRQLVSNSDAHSPAKLGREGNLLTCGLSYPELKRALETGEGLEGTLEFYPEEGKYHLDGHRACQCRLEPEETRQLGGRCPVCGKRVTVGVLSRVEQLADRPEGAPLPKPFESLMPLPELIGESLGCSASSKKAQVAYFDLLERLGPEFSILRERAPEEVERVGGFLMGEALRRLRAGRVIRQAGYDGEYGVIRLFAPGEREALQGQMSLLSPLISEKNKTEPLAPKAAPESAPAQETARAEEMNPAQRQAVESDAPVVAVAAGPGTGKTKTLIARIAYLIEEKGVKPGEITAVTFTRQAAEEMTGRLERRLGKRTARGVTVGTFHALCLSLLDPKPLISRDQARETLAALLDERGDQTPPAQALILISQKKNGLPAPGLEEGLFLAYQERLEQMGLRDLDDLLTDALRMPVKGNRRFHYLLVDEYQDINAVQRALVRHWSEGNRLFVIGDPDQSIYGFRGADAGCFDALLAERPDAAFIRLTENYRSTPEILESALASISRNPGPARVLRANHPSGPAVRLVDAGTGEESFIAREIGRMAGGVDMLEAAEGEREGPARAFSEIAVLCRTHRRLERIENALRRAGIPCVVFGRGDFLEDGKVQGMLGFLDALLDRSVPGLDAALQHLWHCPAGLRARAETALTQEEPLTAAGLRERLTPYDALSPFLDAVEETLPKIRKEKPRRLLESLAGAAGCGGKPVEALLNTAVFYRDAPALLAALRLGEEADIRRLCGGKASGAVRLMTLHAAKGLEFPAVILAGAEEGELPFLRQGEETDVQEERRLFFVGMTRAREELVITHGGKPSPFLEELPPSLRRERAGGRRPAAIQQLRFC